MLKKPIFFIAACLAIVILSNLTGCDKSSLNYQFNTGTKTPPQYPDVFFAHITDTHIFTTLLGSTGEAFEKMMHSDRKLLLESIELLELGIEEIIAAEVSFVIISGDLTKDSETINHKIIAEKLSKFTDANIDVYVIPGNHDVNCSEGVSFSGSNTQPVPRVNEQEFAQIYGDFGYNAALYRDSASLSYVAQPAEGLWLLAIDPIQHRTNVPDKATDITGKISQETADWIADVLREADNQNIAVMAMMHHGFMEHWKGQAKLHPKYIINDYKNFGKFLASWNVRIGFSGHYHAHDITRSDFKGGKFLYDIETGSLVTAPCPIRYIRITDNVMDIRSDFIVDKLRPGTDYAENANAFVKKTVMLEAANTLRKNNVSEKDIAIISEAVGDAFAAHYAGDEDPALRPVMNKSKLGLWGRIVLSTQNYVLNGLWQDLPPADRNVVIDLSK